MQKHQRNLEAINDAAFIRVKNLKGTIKLMSKKNTLPNRKVRVGFSDM